MEHILKSLIGPLYLTICLWMKNHAKFQLRAYSRLNTFPEMGGETAILIQNNEQETLWSLMTITYISANCSIKNVNSDRKKMC